MSDHSFEEIRAVTLNVLSGRENVSYPVNQYRHVESGVAEVFARREGTDGSRSGMITGGEPSLSSQDQETFMEVFWSLFQQGIIILGSDRTNNGFPWCRISALGKKALEDSAEYFFHDVSSYEEQLKTEIPQINEVTLVYLKEAMQAFRAGCLLSATVMLGVASEHSFNLLLDQIRDHTKHRQTFASVFKKRAILQKVNKFKAILAQNYGSQLPGYIKEDLDTHFASLQSVIRAYRNQSGHPTGKFMTREQVYVLLHLFIPYGKKLRQLIDFFK